MIIKNMKYVELNTKITTAFLKTKTLNLIQQNRNVLCCNKNYQKRFDGNLKKLCFNTYIFSNHDKKKLAKRVCKAFKIRNLEDYCDLYVHYCQLTYLKAFIICVEIYEFDPVHFLSAPGLAWQAPLKNTKVKLDLLTDMDILLMVKRWKMSRYLSICET